MDQRNQVAVSMEDPIRSSNSFFDSFITSCNPSSSTTSFLDLDYTIGGHDDENGSIGFMELLGVHDFCFSNTTPTTTTTTSNSGGDLQEGHRPLHPSPPTNGNYTTPAAPPESPDLLNAPPTPNSSSISSESIICSAPTDELPKPACDEEDEQPQYKTKKHLKPKKRSQKGQKEPRFAFMTKSEVDQLEDGYRWRKYGQKAVKNSPFPRSYYRCTTTSCNVKKRVERSFNDPSIVVTTYEGQHTHPTPMIHRPSIPHAPGFFFTGPTTVSALPLLPTEMTLSQQLQCNNMMTPLNCGFTSSRDDLTTGAPGKRFSATPPASLSLTSEDGLLQDIVPSTMRKEDIYDQGQRRVSTTT